MELRDAHAALQALAGGGPVRQPDPAALDALYASLPSIQCKGKCASACGPIGMSPLERERITGSGFPWVDGQVVPMPDGSVGGTVCSALDQRRLRCRVYDVRPLVCRIWGLVEALKCPWGCVPEGGHLDDVQGLRLMNSALWYGGDAKGIEPAEWERLLRRRPEARLAMLERMRKSRPVREEPVFVQATVRVRRAG